MFKFTQGIIGAVFVLIISFFAFNMYFVIDAKNNGEKVYQIQVNSFNGIEMYMTNEYTKDEKTGCINFKDMVGIKRIVCNNYTITEF